MPTHPYIPARLSELRPDAVALLVAANKCLRRRRAPVQRNQIVDQWRNGPALQDPDGQDRPGRPSPPPAVTGARSY